jgi:rsbT co-antagonist protein RsbR
MSTLLGRRLAILDLTPTATLHIVRILLASIVEHAEPSEVRFDDQLRAAIIEGFVIGREERVSEQSAARAAAPVRPLRLDASIVLLAVTGEHAPEILSNMVDALGRDMLDANANVALVDLTQLAAPNRERARAILAADEMARMLGAACVFSGVDARWESAAVEAGMPIAMLRRTETLREGLALARSIADGARLDARPRWRALLERLRL